MGVYFYSEDSSADIHLLYTEKVAQTILDEYVAKRNIAEVSYKEIIIQIRELKIPFRTPDIAQLAAQYLSEKGIKV